ncbi:MAG: methylmalonyl-CoA epimerase [Zetaproteobacteria bacterium]|nr:methylmalonyl-CoA epimerase [Zetaproteobacteria bacterium]
MPISETPLPFKIHKIDHCALAPKDMSQCIRFFRDILRLPYFGAETVAEQKVHAEMLLSAHAGERLPIETRIELLESTDPSGPVAQFLHKRGAGVHHIAFNVDNMEKATAYLRQQGVEFVDEAPRRGYGGSVIMFVHPRSTGGILCELVQNRC